MNQQILKNVGLFSDFGGIVRDLNIIDAYISIKTKANLNVGILAGVSRSATIINVDVSGFLIDLNTSLSINVGGLTGSNSGEIKEVILSGVINAFSSSYLVNIGGVAGVNGGLIIKSISNVDLFANGEGSASYSHIGGGGIAGSNDGRVISSVSFGITEFNIDSITNTAAGGVVGFNHGTLENSIGFGSVIVDKTWGLGGVVGENRGIISNIFRVEEQLLFRKGEISESTDYTDKK